ncbi:MAG: hypothetical protein GY801_07145, partial [bacterium]|nr:hypothetical protein [bacterium]
GGLSEVLLVIFVLGSELKIQKGLFLGLTPGYNSHLILARTGDKENLGHWL